MNEKLIKKTKQEITQAGLKASAAEYRLSIAYRHKEWKKELEQELKEAQEKVTKLKEKLEKLKVFRIVK